MPDRGEGVVRRVFELFNELFSDGREEALEEMRELASSDFKLVPLRAALEGVSYAGPTAFDQFAAAARESWSQLSIAIEEIRGAEPRFLAIGTLRGLSQEAGADVNARVAFVVETREGLVTLIHTYADLDAAEADAKLAAD